MKDKKPTPQELLKAYSTIVNYLQANTKEPDNINNFLGSPKRAVKALIEMNKSDQEIKKELRNILGKAFPIDRGSEDTELVTQGPIEINSMCPHHLMPVMYEAYVSYLPSIKTGRVLGLSKLSRVSEILGKRPVLQEKLAMDIADVLHKSETEYFPSIESEGSAVSLVGLHCCMCCRGIQSSALTSSTVLRGVFKSNVMEEKFYQAIENIKTSKLRR